MWGVKLFLLFLEGRKKHGDKTMIKNRFEVVHVPLFRNKNHKKFIYLHFTKVYICWATPQNPFRKSLFI